MIYKLKVISHFDFFEQLESYYSTITNLLDASDKLTLTEFTTQANELILKIEEYIIRSIKPDANELVRVLNKSYRTIFDFDYSKYGFDKEPQIKKEIERLEDFMYSLRQLIGYLSIVDTLFDSSNSVLIENISDKNDFILNKLNSLFGDETYSIERILEFNNINYRNNETREIAEDLSRRGYVILNERYGNSDKVKISVKGAAYIERKNKQKKTTKTKNDLDKKIDNIIEQLTKLGYGQEIIFNDIEELRELQHKLSKKSWSQLLKGKLLDLALDKIISTDTATSVYEYLTNGSFKLLK
ncbi:hypothetical protein [Elizabethkingia miricola]|uniref:hypothetical protein n=1 Tax=Elizabethkingia miricola TaxID=172045 RepID=UPI00099A3D46|nr:hypothetical protein [Elizabethkingia miricola]OPC16243.1 hypothetical protein BAY01_00640 [Elizabethkingia miricola]